MGRSKHPRRNGSKQKMPEFLTTVRKFVEPDRTCQQVSDECTDSTTFSLFSTTKHGNFLLIENDGDKDRVKDPDVVAFEEEIDNVNLKPFKTLNGKSSRSDFLTATRIVQMAYMQGKPFILVSDP